MIKKVIFLIPSPVKSVGYLSPAVDALRTQGITTEIWDITSLLNKTYHDLQLTGEGDFEGIRVFSQRKSLLRALADLDKNCLVNCFVGFSVDSFFIYRVLAKRGIQYCGLQMMGLPNPVGQEDLKPSSVPYLLKRMLSLNMTDISNHFFNRILSKHYRLFGIRAVDIVLLGGEKSLENRSYPIDAHSRLLWAHSFDYDTYIRVSSQPALIDTPYCVFLDEYLPFHPDWVDMGIESKFLPDVYYPKLCKFFETIERELQVPVIIAAHPKSDYEVSADYFQGRKIIKGQSARLVKDASFVIVHDSTSVNFAVLFKKPVLFATMDAFLELTTGKYKPGLQIERIAEELKTTPINIDHLEGTEPMKIFNVDTKAYASYHNRYIKKEGSPEMPFWEIFSSYCLRIR